MEQQRRPIVQKQEFIEVLNTGFNIASKADRFSFSGLAAVTSSEPSRRLGINFREIFMSNGAYIIANRNEEGRLILPYLEIIGVGVGTLIHAAQAYNVDANSMHSVAHSYNTLGVALKFPEADTQLMGPYHAAFMPYPSANAEDLMRNNSAHLLGPDPHHSMVDAVNALYALAADITTASS